MVWMMCLAILIACIWVLPSEIEIHHSSQLYRVYGAVIFISILYYLVGYFMIFSINFSYEYHKTCKAVAYMRISELEEGLGNGITVKTDSDLIFLFGFDRPYAKALARGDYDGLIGHRLTERYMRM